MLCTFLAHLRSSSKAPGRGARAAPAPGAGWGCPGVMAQQLWKSQAVIHWEAVQEGWRQGQYSMFPLSLVNFLSIAEVTGSL